MIWNSRGQTQAESCWHKDSKMKRFAEGNLNEQNFCWASVLQEGGSRLAIYNIYDAALQYHFEMDTKCII